MSASLSDINYNNFFKISNCTRFLVSPTDKVTQKMVLFKTNNFTTCLLTVGSGFEQPNEKHAKLLLLEFKKKKTHKKKRK